MGMEIVIVKPDKYEYFTLGKGFRFFGDEILSSDMNSPKRIDQVSKEDIYQCLLSHKQDGWSETINIEVYFREIADKLLKWSENDPVCISTDDALTDFSAYDPDSPGYDETGTRYDD